MQFLSRASRFARTVSSLGWKTTLFGDSLPAGLAPANDPVPPGSGHIYRLKHWPQLPEAHKTADVYRALSVMSHRPVNRRWMLTTGRIRSERLDDLLRQLVAQGAVEVIDPRGFSGTAS